MGLGSALPRADFGGGNVHHHHHAHDAAPAGEKKCTLERSLTETNPECFLEPECENKCEDVTRTVKINENLKLNFK